MKNIPEESVTSQVAQHVAPDVVSQQGQQQLQAKAVAANKIKGVLDQAFQMAAKSLSGKASSRIKDIDTAQKKIVQKRLQGRDYGIADLNDMLGIRLTVDKADIPKAKKEVENMQKAGLFTINKQEEVKTGNYSAYHFDITAPDGTKAEAQIMSPQQEAESMLNHSMRSVAGENPDAAIKTVTDAQASIAKKLPNEKANQVAETLKQLMKQNNNNPLPPTVTAQVAQSVNQ